MCLLSVVMCLLCMPMCAYSRVCLGLSRGRSTFWTFFFLDEKYLQFHFSCFEFDWWHILHLLEFAFANSIFFLFPVIPNLLSCMNLLRAFLKCLFNSWVHKDLHHHVCQAGWWEVGQGFCRWASWSSSGNSEFRDQAVLCYCWVLEALPVLAMQLSHPTDPKVPDSTRLTPHPRVLFIPT